MTAILIRPATFPEVTQQLGAGSAMSSSFLFKLADRHFGGTQGAGTYSAADAYDLAEMTLHRLILDRRVGLAPTVGLLSAQLRAEELEDLGALLPTRTRRDDEVLAFDQFSTPPALAFAAAWLGSPKADDLVLEPSGGTGALAVQARNAGSTVICVELSERRAAILEALGFQVIRENADHLNSVLPKEVMPSLVLMNPPFTATAGRLGEAADPMTAARHVEQSLKRLRKGGRVVAILPPGMGFGTTRYRDWWRSIVQSYSVKANVLLDARAFKKAGTGIAVRLVVIDKTGLTSSGARPIGAELDSVNSLMAVLESVRLNRPHVDGVAVPRPTPTLAPLPAAPNRAVLAMKPAPTTRPASQATRRIAERVAIPDAPAAPVPAITSDALPEQPMAAIAVGIAVGAVAPKDRFDAPLTEVKYEPYQPQRLKIEGAHPHPSKLVESAAMSAVLPPEPTYSPHFPESVILDGKLSFAQVEAVVYAGQAHAEFLPAGPGGRAMRAGFAIGDGTGVGKGRAQPLEALVLTPAGWKQMGELKFGDAVVTADGTISRITGLFPQGECDIYRISFSDGTSTECTADHLWLTQTRRQRYYEKKGWGISYANPKVITTSQIQSTIRLIHSIPLVEAVQFTQREILLDPYVLGALLADGSLRNSSSQLVNADREIIESVIAALPQGMMLKKVASRDYHYDITSTSPYGKGCPWPRNDVQRALRIYDLTDKTAAYKFVPDAYKFNTPEIRLALLQGLMDCDGHVNQNGACVYYTVSKKLADDVQFLVQSLGGTATRSLKPTNRLTCHVIFLRLPEGVNPCRMTRKAKLVRKTWVKYPPRRYIKNVECIGRKVAQCISISHPSHLYVTNDFIVTHNTAGAVILDNWYQGRDKALWITKNDSTLLGAARRDWGDLGGDPEVIFPMSKVQAGELVKATRGIMLVSTGTLRSKPRDKVSRLQQILNWLGPDFDGVIISDEHHAAANAVETDGSRGKTKASQTGLASVELQKALPNARIVYISATLADKVENLSSCDRLGLWGYGTPFAGKQQFIAQIKAGGIAAMEIVTRDLKAMGRYFARSLSYEDIRYRRLVHDLTLEQVELYDAMAEAWQLVLANVHLVMELIGTDRDAQAKSKTMSAFWGSHQRFFNQVLTAMMMPTILREMEADVAAGRSPLLYFVNTNEAAQERALAREGAEENLEDLDMSPRESLLQYLEMCFPVKQHESYMDEVGNLRMRVALDSDGKPVINTEAEEIRDDLLLKIGSLRVPNGPLEQLLDRFGTDKVAELTGRSRRVVRKPDGFGGFKTVIENRSKAHMLADLLAFQDDVKPVVAYSNAGNTGIDLHASRKFKNRRQRVLYIAQAGWSAKEATQACGRPHRSDQESAPEIALCATSLKGHKRFMSSIARRLGSLGALTKGQRNTGEQGLFTARDDLEGEYGNAALFQLIMDLNDGKDVAGLSINEFQRQLGLKLLNEEGDLLKDKLPPVKQFLNRLLSMNVGPMDRLFDEFASRLDQAVEAAAEAGLLNIGMETVIADSIEVMSPPRVVYTEPRSKAESVYTELKVWRRNVTLSYDAVREKHPDILQFVTNKHTNRTYAQRPAHNRTDPDGKVIAQYRLVGPLGTHYVDAAAIDSFGATYRPVSEGKIRALWQAEIGQTEPFTVEAMHVISGVLLPIWDKLEGAGEPRVFRLQTDDGQRILGRVIPATLIRQVLQRLGANYGKPWSAKEVIETVLAGHRLQLANGWHLQRVKVAGENRIEVSGPSMGQFLGDLKRIGVKMEYYQSATRFFVPHGGPATMEKLIQNRPIVDGAV